ncbi:TPA: hypothetical protein DEP21_00710 [Patescibacteria group bacterium]|nr:hypothetical protein [Candidatus Gracilibacteria bacterium]
MAEDVGMTLEDYWQQIIKACYLDFEDPIVEWKKTFSSIQTIIDKLNAMKIQTVHVV